MVASFDVTQLELFPWVITEATPLGMERHSQLSLCSSQTATNLPSHQQYPQYVCKTWYMVWWMDRYTGQFRILDMSKFFDYIGSYRNLGVL